MFVMNIAEFEYIYNFSYTVSSCCEAVQIYYNGKLALRIYESQQHRNCGNLGCPSAECSGIYHGATSSSMGVLRQHKSRSTHQSTKQVHNPITRQQLPAK